MIKNENFFDYNSNQLLMLTTQFVIIFNHEMCYLLNTFENYLIRLKQRRTEDEYRYTDEDFQTHIEYIKYCYNTNLSVYKCLEFMYFETQK